MKTNEIKSCIEYLEENGFLEYGRLIPNIVFVKLFQEECSKSWDFLGPLLEIREELTSLGYLCTQRDIEFGCLKILDVDEMIIQADRLFKNTGNRIKKLQRCLYHAKVEEFTRTELDKHMHVTNKITTGLNAMRSILSNL